VQPKEILITSAKRLFQQHRPIPVLGSLILLCCTKPLDLLACDDAGLAYEQREFITLLGSAAAWPRAARVQQGSRMRRIGVLMNLSQNDLEAQRLVTAFREGLAQLGWADGRNLRIDYRWAGGDVGRIRAFAKELVELSPEIIVAYATPSVVALQQLTRTIPIIFLSVTDPVGQGLVASLAHPGGNITGFAVFEFSLGTKWMEALKQIAPSLRRVTTIFNPATAPHYPLYLRTIEEAASSFAVEPIVAEVHDDAENRARHQYPGA
jgi:putative tryptophan/tyrosine transport system substrate-binding protein